jgi:hypothetical protein
MPVSGSEPLFLQAKIAVEEQSQKMELSRFYYSEFGQQGVHVTKATESSNP